MVSRDYVVVGGGIAGITIAEQLTRLGYSVTIVDSEEKLGADTSAKFHQWLHLGALYALKPGQLTTAKYVLGAIDDLFRYYGHFDSFNLDPVSVQSREFGSQSFKGLSTSNKGWFHRSYPLDFNFARAEKNPVWRLAAARAKSVIDNIGSLDWNRRTGGDVQKIDWTFRDVAKNFMDWNKLGDDDYFTVPTHELQMNSHKIMTDLVSSFLTMDGETRLGSEVTHIDTTSGPHPIVLLEDGGRIEATERVIVASGENVSKLMNVPLNSVSHAPISIVKFKTKQSRSVFNLFVNPDNCSNVLVKGDGQYGMVGGYTYDNKADAYDHLAKVHERLRADGWEYDILDEYLGTKSEFKVGGRRNYLYHIWGDDKVVGALPGKFTLAFSLAPEIVRQLTGKAPQPTVACSPQMCRTASELVAKPLWEQIVSNHS